MGATNSNTPKWGGREVFRLTMWSIVAYTIIIAFKYLDHLMAIFASLTLISLVGTIEDLTGGEDE